MGFFSKDKVSIEELANTVAELVFNSVSSDSLAPFRVLLKGMELDAEISDTQKKEILILHMLGATRAIQKSAKSNPQHILDLFHDKVYQRVSDEESKQSDFERLVQDRYQEYYRILSSREDNMMFVFGKSFADHFTGQESGGKALPLIVSSAEIYGSIIEHTQKFLTEIYEKFEIVDSKS